MDGNAGIELDDGAVMPRLGLGVWKMTDAVAASAVRSALELGYRSIDGQPISQRKGRRARCCRVRLVRDFVFITTKLPSASRL